MPPQSPSPSKRTYPNAAATKPGSNTGIKAAPSPTPASVIITPATIGPPKIAEIAENEPALARTFSARGPARARPVIRTPTAEPSAISGASGPRTPPNASVPSAASAIPGAWATGTAPPPIPTSGSCPPLPGSTSRAKTTMTAPITGSPMTRYQGGAVSPRWLGRSVHSQVLCLVHGREKQRCDERSRYADDRTEGGQTEKHTRGGCGDRLAHLRPPLARRRMGRTRMVELPITVVDRLASPWLDSRLHGSPTAGCRVSARCGEAAREEGGLQR